MCVRDVRGPTDAADAPADAAVAAVALEREEPDESVPAKQFFNQVCSLKHSFLILSMLKGVHVYMRN